jgi:hypothetical protein
MTLLFLAANLAVCALCVAQSVASEEPLTLAIFDFQGKDKALTDTGALVRDLLEAKLSGRDTLRIVTRTEMDKVLQEQKVNLAGLTDESAPQIGRLLGAQAMIVGRVFTIGDKLFLTARLFGTETSRAFSESVNGEVDQVEKLAESLSSKVGQLIEEKSDQLVAKILLKEDQVKELMAKLGPEKRPRVFVSIRERTIDVPTIDPAAQTEFQYILLKTGFEAIKDKSGVLKTWVENYQSEGGKTAPPPVEAADILLVGEGISEFASRNGDLVSFRCRLEIEALSAATGKVLAVDRETTTAVDLSNQIAGKKALQEAAARIAFRLIPDAVAKWREEKPTP